MPSDSAEINRLTPVQRTILKNSVLSTSFKMDLRSYHTNKLLSELKFTFPKLDEPLLVKMMHYYSNRNK